MNKRALLIFVALIFFGIVRAQENTSPYLLDNIRLQFEVTDAVNNLYNFKFAEAEKEFNYIRYRYKSHPLPYFLLGLSNWWKIAPNIDNKKYDKAFLGYMDTVIYLAEHIYNKDEGNIEAAFFLSAAYGFKGRLYSERSNWSSAAFAGRQSLKYLSISRGQESISPEFLFGDALFNYYAVWIPEHYPYLKPIVSFFPDGDKKKGMEQLIYVSNNTFYTRTEAQTFLMRIYQDENQNAKAIQVSEYLHQTFPDNPFFHRYYSRLLYLNGRYREAEQISLSIIQNIDSGKTGYEATSGRYAAFFLGQIYDAYKQPGLAKLYYERAVAFGEEIEAQETGYYIYSLLYLGIMADKEKDKNAADKYFKLVKKYAKRDHPAHKKAREYLKSKKK